MGPSWVQNEWFIYNTTPQNNSRKKWQSLSTASHDGHYKPPISLDILKSAVEFLKSNLPADDLVQPIHHHHNQFLINMQVHHPHQWGPLPGNWLAAHIADLTPDLQVLLS